MNILRTTIVFLGVLLGSGIVNAQIGIGVGGGSGGTQISGTPTAGNCAKWLDAKTLEDAGGPCGTSSMVYPSAGIALSTGTAWSLSLTAPAGTIVGTTDTQTLTNKTLDGVTPTVMGFLDATSSIQTQLNAKAPTASPTFTGKVTTAASALGGAGFNLPPGTAPTTPANGDLWTTTAGLYAQINGATVGPYGVGGGGNVSNTGTPAQYQLPYWNNSTVIGGISWLTGYDGVQQVMTETTSAGSAALPVASVAGVATNAQTGTTYTVLLTDRGKYVTFSNASAIAVTLPQAGSSGFDRNFVFVACDIGAGTATITPTTSAISYTTGGAYTSGATSLALATGQCATLYSDNTNYFAIVRTAASIPSGTFQTNGTNNTTSTSQNLITSTVNSDGLTATPSNPGTNQEKIEITGNYSGSLASGTGLTASQIPAALSSTTSVNGTSIPSSATLTQTICSGTVALGTTAIASGAAATTVTATCTGLATTDVINLSFNGSPLAVTGYVPSANGMLTIIDWPTANTINVSVVNNTSASVTPGAITLNYRVTR